MKFTKAQHEQALNAFAASMAAKYGPIVSPYAQQLKDQAAAAEDIKGQREALKETGKSNYQMVRDAIFFAHQNGDEGSFARMGVAACLESLGVKADTVTPYAGTIEIGVNALRAGIVTTEQVPAEIERLRSARNAVAEEIEAQ